MHLLLNYASFLRRARGDVEAADIVLRRAAEVNHQSVDILMLFMHVDDLRRGRSLPPMG